MKMKSTTGGQHQFTQIPSANIQRSTFNRSCGLKTAFNAGLLIPVFTDEALPGDTMNLRMSTFARMATPIYPILDNLRLTSFFFAIPYRLVWDNFQKFMGEQANPADSTDFTIPTMPTTASTGQSITSLADYFGIPTGVPDLDYSALWTRAYYLTWNEFFRDENTMDSVVFATDDGPDPSIAMGLKRRGKRKDYMTSCLPFPQKGASVLLPLGTSAVVTMDTPNVFQAASSGSDHPTWDINGNVRHFETDNNDPTQVVELDSTVASSGNTNIEWSDPNLETDIGGALGIADLSTATAATVNELRQSFAIQKLRERDARGGSRYTEILRAHFGVVSPDQRLQRPEYLGGGVQIINATPVPQTSSTDGTSPQGNLSAYATSSGSGHSFTKSFTEHSLIIGMVCVTADLNYQQGLERMWSRQTKEDHYWGALAHLGEQVVKNKEIYAQGSVDAAADEAAFGYQERWAEYRYKPSKITGIMRSTAAGSLDPWHLAQEFTSLPVLNTGFIEENPPMNRILAIPTEPDFLFDAFFDFTHARAMPTFSVPGMIDRF